LRLWQGAALEAFALQSRYPTLTMQTKHTLTGAAVPSSSGATSFTTTSTTAVLRPVAHTAESGSFQRKIILLKDPPGYEQGGSESQRQRLREMYAFVLAFQCPVVMVRSDVSGRDDFQFAADGSLPYHIRQRWVLLDVLCSRTVRTNHCMQCSFMCAELSSSMCNQRTYSNSATAQTMVSPSPADP
jgi:hypothetical protein